MRKLLLVALLVMGLAACARPAPDTLKIGSKPFPESELLADMLAILAQERGIPVTRIGNLGGTKITFDALKSGSIDVYPEYTGTGLMEILQQAATNDPNEALELVRQGFLKAYDIEWLEPLGFNNTYALAMKTAEMKALGIRTISQLAPKSGGLIFGCSHEFYDRPDGYPGLVEFYGLHFKKVERLQHGLAYQALLQDKIDLTDVYSTDGRLDPETMTVLVDDRHFFPPYYAAPVARREALLRFPAAREALNALAGRIDDPTMQRLNRQVEVEKVPSKEVALNFLRKQGLVRGEAGALQTGRGGDVAQVLWARRGEIAVLVGQHLALTGVAMGLAIAVGIPLGIVISRSVRLAAPVLVAAGVLQTIPSIALLAFMIPYLGLGAKPAIAALFLYALLPVLRNTYTGIRGVDPALVEVGLGMGLRARQILTLVEIPLAMPVIMAGIRTAAVISIGTATLAAWIGAGGLGDPIVTGLTRNDVPTILTGAIPAAVLAVVVDLALGGLERLVTPRTG